MRSSSGDVFAGPVDAPAGARRASRWAWVAFDPPLRDPRTMSAAEFHVSCRVCGRELGRARDPVEALRLAWRSRRHPRHHTPLFAQP
jgi:hypothetical protein